jgi:NAD+ diphosphatase
MPYPELINLPFNFSCISDSFTMLHPSPPGGEPAESGAWAIIQGNGVVVCNGEPPSLPEGDLPAWLTPSGRPLCIGTWQGRPLRAFSIRNDLPLIPPFGSEAFNAAGQRLDIRTLTLAGLARQILHWEQQSRHCSACGGTTEGISGTWGKRCSICNTEHFPHIHPCAIVLVTRGDELLLTRKAGWPPGRYSLVAGFLDFGESLEECAIREVREETGVTIRNIRYAGSQSWPFPSQLMAGFLADYAGGEVMHDPHELEDARWFRVDALPSLPPARSIARHIIDNHIRASGTSRI